MEYLYHYTNIESLALILKNHTIRFSSLDQMDDKQENLSADLKNAGQFCYVSSWTSDSEESIPMWNMYSSLDSGVRIKMRKNPFYIYPYNRKHLLDLKSMYDFSNFETEIVYLYQPIQEVLDLSFLTYQMATGAELYQVKYTKNINLLYPKIVSVNNESINIGLGEFGKYKNMHWTFQNEWRYRWTFLPIKLDNHNVEEAINIFWNDLLAGSAVQPFKYYDNRISDEAYSEMEITLSPAISSGNEELIVNTIKKYNPTATIVPSSLKGLL